MKCLERMVNRMVYCKIKERNADSAVYLIGARTDDMTGEIIFSKAIGFRNSINKQKNTR